MLGLFQAFVEQVGHMGVKGLAECVHPAAGKAVGFFGGVWKRWQEKKQKQQQREEIEAMARMTAAQVASEIREQLQHAIPDNPPLRSEVEIYLSLAPAAVRATLKRPADPTGRSLPAEFSLRSQNDLVELFPAGVPQFRPGDSLPGLSSWTLIEVLGAGGFGEVWLAAHAVDEARRAAVKFCTDPTAKLPLIEHELKQVVRLMKGGGHPNLVPLHEYNLGGEKPWLMYEYVGGGTLADAVLAWQILRDEQRRANAVAALVQLATAVAHLHKLTPSLVHRDLKPANVLRCDRTGHFRVTDLGLGGSAAEYELSLESQGGRSLTGRLPSMLGGSHTPLYASPEQRKGHAPDPRDDVHALGVIAYQMLTGKLDSAPGVEMADELVEVGVPVEFIEVIRRCVSTKPEKRPTDAGDLIEALKPFHQEQPASSPVVAAPVPASPPVVVSTPKSLFDQPVSVVASTTSTIEIRLRGKWWWRPLGQTKAVWKVDVDTPARVDLDPEREYRLDASTNSIDPDLASLKSLENLTNFVRLELSNCTRLTAAGLAYLAGFKKLMHLNLYGCSGLGDAALAQLRQLDRLSRLDLTRCSRLTDEGLAHVSWLVALEHLDLSSCEWISDGGLVHLSRLPKLRHLGVRNTQVTDSGVSRLCRAIPSLSVDR